MSELSKAVFLSYASQDAGAAGRLAEALRLAGVEVWIDQSELRGGDAWDAKIRRQIKECALFIPVISGHTDARPEGYFRLEWKLAVDRSHLLADDHPFLFPVVLGDVNDAAARVPDKFRDFQWTRLRPDEGAAVVARRVARLLGGEGEARDRRIPAFSAGSGDPVRPGSRKRGPLRPWFGSAMAVALAMVALAIWQPWRHATAPIASAGPASALSPARALVAKARPLFDQGDDSIRENLTLAEDMLRQAEKLDPFDGEVWAAHAQLSGIFLDQGYDESDERRAGMGQQAERAIKLAPDSEESQLANAWYLLEQRSTWPEAEVALSALIKRAPGDWRPLLLMGYTRLYLGHFDEAMGWFEKAAAIPGGAAVAKLDEATELYLKGRIGDAEKAVDKSLAIRPLGGALLLKLRGQVLWDGDLDGARRTLERMPSSLLLEDRGAFNAFRLWLWRREPDKALSVVRGLSHDFLEDEQFSGPKAELTAAAETLAGRTDLARVDWALALREVEQRLQEDPNNSRLLYHRAHCLIELGRSAEGAEALRGFRQTGASSPNMWPGGGVPGLLVKLGHPSEAMDDLESQVAHGFPVFTSRAVLSLNPDFDPLRRDPRFQAILAHAPGPMPPALAAESKS